jgi:SAM-dependent methyltransferase
MNPQPPPGDFVWRQVLGLLASQAICVAAELGLADQLALGPRDPVELSKRVGADPVMLARLMRYLESIGFFRGRPDGTYENTPASDALRSGVPASMRDFALMVRALLFPAAVRFMDTVNSGTPAFDLAFGHPLFDHLSAHPNDGALFANGMAAVAQLRNRLAVSYAWPDGARVVDVGGSDGAILTSVLKSRPDLTGVVFDLPHLADPAKAHIRAAGLTDRCHFTGGDFFSPDWPRGDVYLLSGVLHDWADADAARILANARRCISHDGKLVILDVALPAGPEPHPGKLLDLVMMTMATGQERSEAQWSHLLDAAGFAITEVTPSPRVSLIEARPA